MHIGSENRDWSSTTVIGKPVARRLEGLHLHPSCDRHNVTVSSARLEEVVALGDLAFRVPLLVNHMGFIITGQAQYVVATRQNRPTLECIEFELDQAETLRWFVELNRDSQGLNDYQRVLLALDLEDSLRVAAHENQRNGAQHRGLQNFAKGPEMHLRAKIAQIAGVCGWQVDKVKFLIRHAIPGIREAVRNSDISIHRGWIMSKQPPQTQEEELRQQRLHTQLLMGVRKYARKRRQEMLQTTESSPALSTDQATTLLRSLSDEVRAGTVKIAVINQPAEGILMIRVPA